MFSPNTEESVRLRLLALGILWVSALGLGWAGGNWWFVAAGCVMAGGGHYASWRWRHQRSKLRPLVIGLVVVGLSFWMRFQAIAVLNGDWVPVGHFLILVLGISSFDQRTRGGLYTSTALSGTVLFFASQQAFGTGFIVFFIGFLGFFLGFMALSFLEDAIKDAKAYWRKGSISVSFFWIGATCTLFLLSGLAFWLIPRGETSLIGPPQVSILPYSASTLVQAEGAPEISPDDLASPRSKTQDSLPKNSNAGGQDGSAENPSVFENLIPEVSDDKATESSPDLTPPSPNPGSLNDTAREKRSDGIGIPGSPGTKAPVEGVVFYVRSKVASYWRGRTLSSFDGQRWLPESGPSRWTPMEDIKGSWYNQESRNLDNSIRYHQNFFIRQDHPNSVFTGYRGIKLANAGNSLKDSGVRGGDSYRVVSAQPKDTAQRLRGDRTDATDARFLLLPESLERRLRHMSGQIIQRPTTDFQRVERIVAYLAREPSYQPDDTVDFDQAGESRPVDVERFLLNQQAGGDLEYATGLTLLARATGVPARLAWGYLPGVRDPLSGAYMVRSADARTWSEIYFVNHGWVPFDSTPDAAAPPVDAATGVSRLFQGAFGQNAPGALKNLHFDVPEGWPGVWTEKLGRTWWAVAGACVGLTGLALRLWYARWKDDPRKSAQVALRYPRPAGRTRREILKMYHQAENLLGHRLGARRLPWQTALAYTGLANAGSPGLQQHLGWFVQAVWLAAYAPQEPAHALVIEGRQRLSGLKKALKETGAGD